MMFARSFPAAAIFALSLSLPIVAKADRDADWKVLTQGISALPMDGSPGSVAMLGRRVVPLILTKDRECVIAAGYHRDDEKAARIIAMSHTGFADIPDDNGRAFLTNVAKWIGRKERPVVGEWGRGGGAGFRKLGFDVVDVTDASKADTKPDFIYISLHRRGADEALEWAKKEVARGCGVIVASTPWAADKALLEKANAFLAEGGLALFGTIPKGKPFAPSETVPSPLFNALTAIDAILADREGTRQMGLGDKQICAESIDAVLAAKVQSPSLDAGLARLHQKMGWIEVGRDKTIRKSAHPIERVVMRYQARLLDTAPPEKTPAHPSAADFPGAVGDGPAVSKTIAFNATTGPDKLINHGRKTIINTGLYARPGVPIVVTIPPAAVKAGLKVEIGIHIDRNWHLSSWHRFPQVTRTFALDATETRAACAFGGLVSILVPEECKLGPTQATITGAVEAPVFTLGKTTERDWNARIKNAPGAWGYIETPKITGYVPREILQKVERPEEVAKYWQRVMDTSDEFMGYAKWRRRGEAMLTDRDIVAGYGHAGYPVMMAYAAEKGDGPAAIVERGPQKGDWGFLHELGHTFQDSFDGNYTIATHAEVDVNLVPGIAMMLIHDRTAWDNNSHGTFDAKTRIRDWEKWNALPEAGRTWAQACKMNVAYDFYFTMAECFGWELYKKALGRLMDWLQKPGNDPDLDALDSRSKNHKRDRFFLVFSQAAGRNLLPHFKRYGLAQGEFGISESVIAKVANLPEWSGNQPISALTGPATLKLSKGARAGDTAATYKAIDPDAGTRFTFSIPAGNDDGAFAIEKRTGVLRIADPAKLTARQLTVKVSDSTIPETTKELKVSVEVQ